MDYNNLLIYDNGDLIWIESPNNLVPKYSKAGTLRKDGYIGIYIKGTHCFAHRIVWEMHNGKIPENMVIDHIDGNRANNKLENLRLCTFQQNHFNRGKQANNKSGYKGVSWHKQKQKWVAQIKLEGKNKFLGFFTNPEQAYKAYCKKAIEHYGEYARLD